MVAYIVKKGDTMYKLAKRYNVSLDQMIQANPQIPNPNLIYPGQLLYIPIPKGHKAYPKKTECMIPYAPQLLNMYFMSQTINMQPMMQYPQMMPMQQHSMEPHHMMEQPMMQEPTMQMPYECDHGYSMYMSDSSQDSSCGCSSSSS